MQDSQHTRSPRTIMQRLLCAKRLPILSEHISPHLHHLQTAATTRVDHNCPQHARALNLLYMECTGLASPSAKGGHWERLGFQGMDPATDFRAGGVLALAHLLSLFVHDETRACAVWQLSLSEPVWLFLISCKPGLVPQGLCTIPGHCVTMCDRFIGALI